MTTWVGFLTDSDDLSPVITLILYAIFSLVFVYSAIGEYVELYRNLYDRLARHPVVNMPIDVTTTTTISYGTFEGTLTRGDKPPTSKLNAVNGVAAKLSFSVKSFDDGRNFNENAFGTPGYYTASSNYSDQSYKSRIVV